MRLKKVGTTKIESQPPVAGDMFNLEFARRCPISTGQVLALRNAITTPGYTEAILRLFCIYLVAGA
jgi:hypothetical protein